MYAQFEMNRNILKKLELRAFGADFEHFSGNSQDVKERSLTLLQWLDVRVFIVVDQLLSCKGTQFGLKISI